jgi:hypothetical protein
VHEQGGDGDWKGQMAGKMQCCWRIVHCHGCDLAAGFIALEWAREWCVARRMVHRATADVRFTLAQRLLWSCEGISHSRDWTAHCGSHP